MKKILPFLLIVISSFSFAAVDVTAPPASSQQAMLESDSPQLAANKKLVYDFWRTLLVARDLEQAPKYMAEGYIQHNPNAATGLKGFVDYFSALNLPVAPVLDTIDGLISVTAENDLVTMSFVRVYDNPNVAGETYTTTWFDMFRVTDGKITEHWDIATIAARP